MRVSRIAGRARFTVSQKGATVDDVWSTFTAPFDSKTSFWHPSYGMYDVVRNGADGRSVELELYGSAGGRYPMKVEVRDDTQKILRLWKGPSLNPPTGALFNLFYRLSAPGVFLGLIYDFRVGIESSSPVVEIKYREDWQRLFLSRRPSLRNWSRAGDQVDLREIPNLRTPLEGPVFGPRGSVRVPVQCKY